MKDHLIEILLCTLIIIGFLVVGDRKNLATTGESKSSIVMTNSRYNSDVLVVKQTTIKRKLKLIKD